MSLAESLMNEVIEGINKSPLEENIKKEVIEAVKKSSELFEHLTFKAQYKAPEIDYESEIVDTIVSRVIAPIFQSNKVDLPVGRDTYRHIYIAIGGQNEMEFEIKK